MSIRNGRKRTIFISSGFGLLQMVLEPDVEWCVRKEVDCNIRPRDVNETFLIRVWKPLSSILRPK